MKKLKFKTKPYPHQLKATKRAVKQGSHAFFFEPRLGKTKAALDAMAIQHFRGEVERVVVIAPLIALDVWVSQIWQHLAVPARVKVIGEPIQWFYPYHTRHKRTDRLDRRDADRRLKIFLVNYDKFSRRGADEAYRNDHLTKVERWSPDLIVLDESHRCKSAGAVRSQALWRMVRRLRNGREGGRPYVYLLSGTPNPKGYIDLFSQFRILDDEVFGTNKADYEDRYCEYGVGRRRYTILNYKRKKEILRKVSKYASIESAEGTGLANKQLFNPIHITLPGKVRVAYEQLAEEFLTEVKGQTMDAPNAGVRRMRLLQLTGGFTTDGTEIHRTKVDAAKDFLRDLYEQGESVVVYSRFIPEVHALTAVCEGLGFHTHTIHGGVKRRARTEAIEVFQARQSVGALVFQADAGSLAIELTAAAEELFFSLPDSWETFYQCLKRVQGPTQRRPVRYTFLMARGTVDLSVLNALRRKRDMHGEMMKQPRGFLYGL
jgi:SNF2 family DNA or RNA helicase